VKLKKKLPFKKLELTEELNSTFKKGQIGAVLEIIDSKTVFAEFYDQHNNLIEHNGKLVFKIGLHQFEIKK